MTKEMIINRAKEIINNYDLVRPRLILRLANRDRPVVNSYPDDIPANIPVIMPGFCDLCIIASVRLFDGASVVVNKQLMEEWEIESGELFHDAYRNTVAKLPPLMKPITDMLESLGVPSIDSIDEDVEMNILTNTEMWFGASAILYCNNLPDEFYMLPSSIHEVIILPIKNGRDTDMEGHLKEVVKSVNETEVNERERLSDNVYYNNKGKWEVV